MSTVQLSNPHLSSELLGDDHMHHLGFSKSTTDFPKRFGDVKFVCTGGSQNRMKKLAEVLEKALPNEVVTPGGSQINLCNTDRYVMYKVGPVLCVNFVKKANTEVKSDLVTQHGIGMPSMTIMLNEVIKLLHYARCQGVTLFRIGTSGGLGIEAGTVVLTDHGINGLLRATFSQHVLGEEIEWPTNFDRQLRTDLLHTYEVAGFKWPITTGNTFSTDDFYEGQARLDGAFCTYGPEDRLKFLQKLERDHGVRNIEMESVALGALTTRAGIKSALVCVTLLDRLMPHGDQVLLTPDQLADFERRPIELITAYIRSRLQVALINGMVKSG